MNDLRKKSSISQRIRMSNSFVASARRDLGLSLIYPPGRTWSVPCKAELSHFYSLPTKSEHHQTLSHPPVQRGTGMVSQILFIPQYQFSWPKVTHQALLAFSVFCFLFQEVFFLPNLLKIILWHFLPMREMSQASQEATGSKRSTGESKQEAWGITSPWIKPLPQTHLPVSACLALLNLPAPSWVTQGPRVIQFLNSPSYNNRFTQPKGKAVLPSAPLSLLATVSTIPFSLNPTWLEKPLPDLPSLSTPEQLQPLPFCNY